MSSVLVSGGQLLVEALHANGVRHAFGVPGESYLAVLDALRDSGIAFTTCRQEGGAAMMAEAAGKLTGQPGICFVTRGPGATNASAGVHVAQQDSTPMILFVGQVECGFKDREAFQEVDYVRFFSPLAKWAAEITQAARLPEYINRAFAVATSGRPGPVVLALPEDMLMEKVARPASIKPSTAIRHGVDDAAVDAVCTLLDQAQNPLLIAGGSTWSTAGYDALAQVAAQWRLPVSVSLRRQGLFHHAHPCFAGHLGINADPVLQQRVKDSDVVLMTGGRLSEMPSQNYSLLESPNPRQTLVHIHPDPNELGRVYRPDLAIASRADCFVQALARRTSRTERSDAPCRAGHAAYQHYGTLPKDNPGPVQLGAVINTVRAEVPDDAIITSGAGNYAAWLHRYFPFRGFNTQLAPTSGSMGYGLPAALAAKRLYPHKHVICFAGDGCLMMTVQELATAALYNLAVIVIVIDNGMYGTIRLHQEKQFPGRDFGCDLKNPDFAMLMNICGGVGLRVERTADFAPAFAKARAANVPALIHVLIDPEAIAPNTTLSSVRAAAQGRA